MAGAQAVERAIEVLQVVAAGIGSAREIARKTGIPKSTVHRLLQTLESYGLVVKEDGDRIYHLGPGVLRLGMAYLGGMDIRTKAIPHMRRLRDLSMETVGLSVRLGDQRMYVEQRESPFELKLKAEIGRPYPLYCGAPGRLLLAFMSDHDIEAVFDRIEIEPITERTPRTRDEVWKSIRKIRRVGYSVGIEETIIGLATIAVPVRAYPGDVAAALSVSGPVSRFNREHRGEVLPMLFEEAEALSHDLGFWEDSNAASPTATAGR